MIISTEFTIWKLKIQLKIYNIKNVGGYWILQFMDSGYTKFTNEQMRTQKSIYTIYLKITIWYFNLIYGDGFLFTI